MLDLNAGVDLDEVVAVLLVDEKLGGAGVAVVHGFGQADGIVEDSIADISGKILGRRDLGPVLATARERAPIDYSLQ